VDDLSYTSSIDLSGSTTATVNLGYFCVASVDSDQAPGDAEADQPDDICPTYSQIVDEMSDVDTRAYELHNQGTHTSDAAAASTLYQEALAADQLLLLRIGDLIALVGERAEPGALLKEAEAHQGDSVDLYALAYSLWAEANEVYAQGDHAYDEGDDVYDQGDDTYDQGDDAYDQGDEAYDEGDYDRYNALYDSGDALYDEGDALYEQGDAFYGQGDAFYGQGDALISKGNARVQQADELQEEVWRLLAEVRDLLCGQEAAEADAVS